MTENDYLDGVAGLFDKIDVRLDRINISTGRGIECAVGALLEADKARKKVMLIGNGGSSAIAAHIATDAVKRADLPAMTFAEPSMLTCLSNDLGYAEVFAKPLSLFGERGDVLIAISSSGNSENILRAVEEAQDIGMVIITLSGFDPGNRLRALGMLSFFVPAYNYGMVELTHLAILHGVIDTLITKR